MSTPYIGSKISLISKSEIRYEGILYTIDPKESTIALAKVRSFGTENRPAEKVVAPRDEIYEYIIFRASDIKDLIVDECGSYTPGLSDPAIIQAQTVSSKTSKTIPNQAFGSAPSGTSSATTAYNLSGGQKPTSDSSNSFVGFSSAGAASAPLNHGTVTGGPPSTAPAFAPSSSGGSQGFRSTNSTPTHGHRKSPGGDSGPPIGTGLSHKDETHRSGTNLTRDGGNQHRDGRPNNRQFFDDQRRWPNRRGGGQGGGGQMQRPPQNFRRGQDPRRPMWQRPPPQPRAPASRGHMNRQSKPDAGRKLEEEYDFEKANQEFQELESKLANMKVADEKDKEATTENCTEETAENKKDDEENTFYDKTRSFFDKISCEALERSKGKTARVDRRQERKMNAETFGITNSYRRQGNYRGRGGGYFGRYRNYSNYNRNYGSRAHATTSGGAGDANPRRTNGPSTQQQQPQRATSNSKPNDLW